MSRKELRQDRNNKDFLDLELVDASGSIVGKAWSDSAALTGEFEAHQFVAFRGQVKLYRDQLQLNVIECRQATEDDRRFGFDESTLIPSTREDIDDLWSRLEAIVTGGGVERPRAAPAGRGDPGGLRATACASTRPPSRSTTPTAAACWSTRCRWPSWRSPSAATTGTSTATWS